MFLVTNENMGLCLYILKLMFKFKSKLKKIGNCRMWKNYFYNLKYILQWNKNQSKQSWSRRPNLEDQINWKPAYWKITTRLKKQKTIGLKYEQFRFEPDQPLVTISFFSFWILNRLVRNMKHSSVLLDKFLFQRRQFRLNCVKTLLWKLLRKLLHYLPKFILQFGHMIFQCSVLWSYSWVIWFFYSVVCLWSNDPVSSKLINNLYTDLRDNCYSKILGDSTKDWINCSQRVLLARTNHKDHTWLKMECYGTQSGGGSNFFLCNCFGFNALLALPTYKGGNNVIKRAA